MAKTKQMAFVEEPEFELDPLEAKYVYELVTRNDPRGNVYDGMTGRPVGEGEFKPFQNLLLRSAIVLNKEQAEKFKRNPGKHIIEYYDGCTTLFADQHPEEKEMVVLRNGTNRDSKAFNRGLLEVYGFDNMFKEYLDMCSWNEASPYRVRTVQPIFRPVDSESLAESDSNDLDLLEQAMELAKNASDKKLRIHGRFLGVSEVDIKTGNPASPKAMRAEYRKAAKNNPKEFIKTYNDKSLELKAWIAKGLEVGEINTSIIPNQAVWKSKGSPICDISGLESREGILNRLIEFASSDEGSDFNEQLRSLYN